MTPEDSGLCVRSDVLPDGSYGVTVTAGPDLAFTLDRSRALPYAAACCREATAAEYFTAVLRLLTERTATSREDGLAFVQEHLVAIPDLAATAPLQFLGAAGRPKPPSPEAGRFTPIVLIRDQDGKDMGWFSPEQIRGHATAVLDTLAVVDLDTRLLRTWVDDYGLPENNARAAVGSLAAFLPGPLPTPTDENRNTP
ncbi:hypothetical protein [Nocardia wallacei]|uniref:hypothetical protein n=1 Tax=Nocardia wallacei TaxID=480035 RepID=UPI0024583F14|nr:hypothetical protein [Nocardia wallacei]